jgi:excisionase family DNA binding protein
MSLQVLTIQEVATQLKVSEDTILRQIKANKLSAAKIGKQWRIAESDLNTFFKTQSLNAKKKTA